MFHAPVPRLAALLGCVLAAASARAQGETPPASRAPDERTQKLVDEFIGIMPRDPGDLRKAEVRDPLAPKALPVLQRIREHVAAHPDCAIAARVHEFTVYALVLDDSALRATLSARRRDGDRAADLLLCSADVIRAADAEHRAKAIDGCLRALGKARDAVALDSSTASCAVQCLLVAADLSRSEVVRLAEGVVDENLARRLREHGAHDPRRLLDLPFEVDGKLADGTRFRSGSLKGKVVLIDFWASWCGPCVKALPELVRLRREHGAERLAIVGVTCDSDEQKLKAFLAEHPEVDWPQLFAGEPWHPIATEVGVDRIPRLFLIDREGVLRSIDAAKDLDGLVRRYLAQ
ncbi:MAG TPA: TlpA disulfide reductase family protein [Planctomycetota bacterium]|nr:TlpA disulfide reductase family protein [Planctomycetota bacterium]